MLRICSVFLLFIVSALAQPVDWIWSARWVVAMDPQRRLIANGAVAVRSGKIVAIGTKGEIDREYQPRQRLDRPNALILPGLINTHTHAAMSLFRGIADDVKLQDWLQKYIFPAEAKNVNPEFVRWGTRLACLEMLLSGTTTYVDMYYFEDTVAEVTREAGMRGVLGETIIGFPSPDYKTSAAALAGTERFIQRFHNDSLIVPAVAPHAIYTNSDETLEAARTLANRYNVPLVMHLSETKQENDEIFAKRKMSPTRLLETLGVLNGRTLVAHGVWLDDPDLDILKAHNVGIAHCPSSNMKLASGVAPVMKMLQRGMAVGLGTDGVAGSNNDVNMMEEMDLAAKLQKVATMDPRALNAQKAVAMATILGARAIGMDGEIGSLEAGKLADLITIRLDEPNAVPLYNVYSQIVYALKGWDVNDVMVQGKLLVRDRRAFTLDRAAILAKAAQYQLSVATSLRAK